MLFIFVLCDLQYFIICSDELFFFIILQISGFVPVYHQLQVSFHHIVPCIFRLIIDTVLKVSEYVRQTLLVITECKFFVVITLIVVMYDCVQIIF